MTDYYTNKRGTVIGVGDYVDDPMDHGNFRKVLRIEPYNYYGATCGADIATDAKLHMADGGVIGANEVLDFDLLRPSEVVKATSGARRIAP